MKADCIINESKFLLTPETYTQEQWHKMFGILKEKFLLLHEENKRLNNIINELEEDLDYEINDYIGNIDMKEETLSGEFCMGIAWEADYLKNRIKELKEGKE